MLAPLTLLLSPACLALLSHTATPVRHPTARLQRSVAPRIAVAAPLADAAALAPEDAWVANFDTDGFRKEVDELGDKLLKQQGPEDVKHLKKMIMWSNVCAAVGLGTMWMAPNPVTIFAISTWIMSRRGFVTMSGRPDGSGAPLGDRLSSQR